MHNNYYFLRQLTRRLEEKLIGCTLKACFSQVKDELILGFVCNGAEFYIRAYLQSNFSCLSFPVTFARANKNTADIFPQLLGKKVIGLIQFDNERSFALKFDQGYALLFKLYGNRANLILFENEQVKVLFKKNLAGDSHIEWHTLNRHLSQRYDDFLACQGNLQKIFPTFGKIIKLYLHEQAYDRMPLEMQWKTIMKVKQQMETPEQFFLTKVEGVPTLSLLKIGAVFSEVTDPMEALNQFFITYTRDYFFEKEKQFLLRQLAQLHKSTEAYIIKTDRKLREVEEGKGYDKIANIIMANLHQIPPKASEVELFDFYHNKMITIKLNNKITAQKNAENLYRKSKNQQVEIENMRANILAKRKQRDMLLKQVQEVEGIDSLKYLRKYRKEHERFLSKEPSGKKNLFKTFEMDGFQILVGKNAKNNDLLTQKHAFKEDLWLHAKDVSGSHVIIKYQAGKKFPKPVIEKAAQLAAYYSQRKTDSLCPVIFTPKKFVRKPKGGAPGAVVVEKEAVVMVKPELPEIN